jgi:hypothetical protein
VPDASALKFLEVAATNREPSNLIGHARHLAAEILLALRAAARALVATPVTHSDYAAGARPSGEGGEGQAGAVHFPHGDSLFRAARP